MKRLLYPIIACCTAVLFLAACNQDSDLSGGSVTGDGNSILLDLASASLPVSRAAATGAEVRVDHIDVLIFGEDSSKKYHERVSGTTDGSGTIALAAKRSGFDANAKYWVYLIANSTADESKFAADDFNRDRLLGETQETPNIFLTGATGYDAGVAPETFLMDGIAYPADQTDPGVSAAAAVVLNDGDRTADTRLKVTLRRAAAKLVIRIRKGDFVEFNNDPGTDAGYYLRNMPYSTSVVAGVGGEAELRTPDRTDNEFFRWTQDDPSSPDNPWTLITVTAYAYAHSWENESALEKETRLIVNIPMRAILHDDQGNYIDASGQQVDDPVAVEHGNSYYQIPVCRGKELARNTCYEVSVTLNVPGGTNPMNPVELDEIEYTVRGWDEKTINIGGEESRPVYLTLNTDEMEMHNIAEDNTTLRFVSSSTVHVSIDEVYYYNATGTKVTLDAAAQNVAHITATPDPALNGNIDITSDVPTNNAIRYIVLTVSNDDRAAERTVTIAQYPLEYITHVVGYYSYRSDFGANGDDGNPTTYERLNGQLATNGTVTSNTQISQRRVACYYSDGQWQYQNIRGSRTYGAAILSFFGSKYATWNSSTGEYNIYYYYWRQPGTNYTYTRTSGYETGAANNGSNIVTDATSLKNPRMYHVQITATSGDYTLGKPRLDADGYTDSGADNAQLVSPSFMIASQLGSSTTATTSTMAKEHCERYVEVAENGTVYDDWRLPTRAEIGIINKFQYQSDAMVEIMDAMTYWCADNNLVTILDANGNEKTSGEHTACPLHPRRLRQITRRPARRTDKKVKTMIRKVIHTAMALLAVAAVLVSCRQDDLTDPLPTAREGYVLLRFTTDLPPMQEVVTRAVDNDGGGVQDMTLFCFDSYGLFISTVTADITPTDDLNGTVTAEVPENTRTIHFLANQNMTDFPEDQFRNHSESEVMALMEGSSGRMIYWARFACDPDNSSNIAQQIRATGDKITMLRNHARVSVDNPTNDYIVVTGMAAYNINAFGTVAAELLGISRSALYGKLEEYGLKYKFRQP